MTVIEPEGKPVAADWSSRSSRPVGRFSPVFAVDEGGMWNR